MNEFSFMEKMTDDEAYLFKRCIRKMLDSTFILEDKDEKLYEFVSSESHQYDMNIYLAAIGFKVVVEDRLKVAMLQQADEDMETVGLKTINLYRFNANQMRLLVVLWLLYIERMGYAEKVYVTVGDIMDKCRIYQMGLKPGEIKEAYRVFKRFSLIDFDDDITAEDGKVRLYPSLQFCMDIKQLNQVIEEYSPGIKDEEKTEEILKEEEEEDE